MKRQAIHKHDSMGAVVCNPDINPNKTVGAYRWKLVTCYNCKRVRSNYEKMVRRGYGE